MTQKEYKEEIEKYEKLLFDNNKRLQEEIDKNYKYEQVLEDYYRVSEDFKREQERNRENSVVIGQLNKTIERYEKILDRVNISC